RACEDRRRGRCNEVADRAAEVADGRPRMTTDTGTRVREINADDITRVVAELCQKATHELPEDVVAGLKNAERTERSPLAKQVLIEILENVDISKRDLIPLCQDTGTTVVLVEVGQDVHIGGR